MVESMLQKMRLAQVQITYIYALALFLLSLPFLHMSLPAYSSSICAAAVAAEQMGLKPRVAAEWEIEVGDFLAEGGEGEVRCQLSNCAHNGSPNLHKIEHS